MIPLGDGKIEINLGVDKVAFFASVWYGAHSVEFCPKFINSFFVLKQKF